MNFMNKLKFNVFFNNEKYFIYCTIFCIYKITPRSTQREGWSTEKEDESVLLIYLYYLCMRATYVRRIVFYYCYCTCVFYRSNLYIYMYIYWYKLQRLFCYALLILGCRVSHVIVIVLGWLRTAFLKFFYTRNFMQVQNYFVKNLARLVLVWFSQ